MRFIGTFASLIMVLWAAARVLRLPVGHGVAAAYMVMHALFVLVCWLATQRVSPANPWYLRLYFVALAPSLILAVWMAGSWTWTHPLRMGMIAAGITAWAAFNIVAHYSLIARRLDSLPQAPLLLLIAASVFYATGCASLMTLFAPLDEISAALRLALGGFWLIQGVLLFGYVHGLAHDRRVWQAHVQWIPQVAAIAIFGWLVLVLGEAQRELAQAGERDAQVELLRLQPIERRGHGE